MSEMTLARLPMGVSAVVTEVILRGATGRRLYDLGCIRGARITAVGQAPFGSLRAYALCGSLIAIRERDAEGIYVRDGTE
ncbi:MAG: ferrous iron transport protein A [Clostridia bacterium]|nr:ferrous iron transport protein A [Clostridia bacterium]